ncbi:hypothetical protein O9X94_17605 [Agrobacterium leguminum]|uniref:Uncharacterized protein n=1 Tax=Agrobacterium leguminum TaxID=2792015 RepID=A0A9X3QVZ4_9HYPH|nr:hypothetical protein [Agrobacterium leguminum]
MTAVFRVLRFLRSRAAGLWRVAQRWISRFGMAVSGWDRPEKATKKLQKNCIFSGKKFCGVIFVPSMIWPRAQHVPPRSPFFTDYGGSGPVCRMRQGMKWKFCSEKWE